MRTPSRLLLALVLLISLVAVSTASRRLPLVTDVLNEQLQTLRTSLTSSAQAAMPVDVLIFMKDQIDMDRIKASSAGSNSDDIAQTLVRAAMELSQLTQRPLIDFLVRGGVSRFNMQTLWISNAISIRGMPVRLLEELTAAATAPESAFRINRIESDRTFKTVDLSVQFERMLDESRAAMVETEEEEPSSIEWNLPWVEATDMWEKGHRGKGITVAISDTGIQYDHPALVDHYRGNLGSGRMVHDYNWWDGVRTAITPRPGPCGVNSTVPCDDSGHGTHCTGTIVGATADGSRQIGVAPEAKFIGCRNMHNGDGRPSTYINCLQFFTAPTDLSGRNHDVSKRPHVISNSYGCPRTEQCEPNSLLEATKMVRAAGIFMSVAAGNEGSRCATVGAPPGIYSTVYSVAALAKKSNTLAYFSSRGPVTVDGSGRSKPDIAAPGQGIVSAYPKDSYSSLSGTSMATPHVAGVIALLWESVPELARNIDQTERIISESALHIPNTDCKSPQPVPNHLYGWGAIRAHEAYKLAKSAKL